MSLPLGAFAPPTLRMAVSSEIRVGGFGTTTFARSTTVRLDDGGLARDATDELLRGIEDSRVARPRDEMRWRDVAALAAIRGHERPLILSEPVALAGEPLLPGCEIGSDANVVLLALRKHFFEAAIELLDERGGTPYRLRVRSDVAGERVPLRELREL